MLFITPDHSNHPVQAYHDNAMVYWPIYPQFLRDLFTKAIFMILIYSKWLAN